VDFTAVSLGAGYRVEKWSWTGRVERRESDIDRKFNLIMGANGEVREGLALSGGIQMFRSALATGSTTMSQDVRFGAAYRPLKSSWIVLERLDFLVNERQDTAFSYDNWRIVNNLNVNYRARTDVQIAVQYACKYVRETIEVMDYRGYTDLTGLEARYDVAQKWDIGVRTRMLHSWSGDQYEKGYGFSVGYNAAKDMLLRIGYNISGFRDVDFSKADFTSRGLFIKLSLKFDQVSVRNAVKALTGQ
jgi:hypothetical protein